MLLVLQALIVRFLQYHAFIVQFILIDANTNNKTWTKYLCYFEANLMYSSKMALKTLEFLLIKFGVSLGKIHNTSKKKFGIWRFTFSISDLSSKFDLIGASSKTTFIWFVQLSFKPSIIVWIEQCKKKLNCWDRFVKKAINFKAKAVFQSLYMLCKID